MKALTLSPTETVYFQVERRKDMFDSKKESVRIEFFLDLQANKLLGSVCAFPMDTTFDSNLLGPAWLDFRHLFGETPLALGAYWLDHFQKAMPHPQGIPLSRVLGAWLKSKPLALAGVPLLYLFPAGNGSTSDIVREKLRSLYAKEMGARAIDRAEYLMEIPLE